MKPTTNKRETTQFTMRINNQLYGEIKQNAVKYKRSIAKQIEFMLERDLKKEN